MNIIRKTFCIGLVVGFLLFLVYKLITNHSVLPLSGSQYFPLLKAPANIYRDSSGKLHIYAGSSEDLYFLEGYFAASMKRGHLLNIQSIVRGNGKHYLPSEPYPIDTLISRLQIAKKTKEIYSTLDQNIISIIDYYCRGINQYFQDTKTHDFIFWNQNITKPITWTPEDVISYLLLISINIDIHNVQKEILLNLKKFYGSEKVSELISSNNNEFSNKIDADSGIPYNIDQIYSEFLAVKKLMAQLHLPVLQKNSKENFLKSASGNDPWLPIHLNSPQLNADGSVLAGIPFILHGQTESIGWRTLLNQNSNHNNTVNDLTNPFISIMMESAEIIKTRIEFLDRITRPSMQLAFLSETQVDTYLPHFKIFPSDPVSNADTDTLLNANNSTLSETNDPNLIGFNQIMTQLNPDIFEEQSAQIGKALTLLYSGYENKNIKQQNLIYTFFVYYLIKNTFQDEMDAVGPNTFTIFLIDPNFAIKSFLPVFVKTNSDWFDNISTPEYVETREEIIIMSFINAIHRIELLYGIQPMNWTWEFISQLKTNIFSERYTSAERLFLKGYSFGRLNKSHVLKNADFNKTGERTPLRLYP